MSLIASINQTTVYVSPQTKIASQANLIITVTNPGDAAVIVNAIGIVLPSALAPVETLDSINPMVDDSNSWNFNASQFTFGEFDATPASSDSVTIAAGDSVKFTLKNVTLTYNIPSPPDVDIDVNVLLVDTDEPVSLPCKVKIDTTDAKITALSVSPATIRPGNSSELNWSFQGIDYCLIDPLDHLDDIKSPRRKPSDRYNVNPDATTTYTVYGHAPDLILCAQITVTVGLAQILSFGANQQSNSVDIGTMITFSWSCNQYTKTVGIMCDDRDIEIAADLMTATAGNSIQKGRITLGPFVQPTVVSLKAYNDDGTSTESDISIGINPLTTTFGYNTKKLTDYPTDLLDSVGIHFTISDDKSQMLLDNGDKITGTDIWESDEVTLTWNIHSVATVDIQPAVPNGPSLKKLSGSVIIQPTANITYTLTTTGLDNAKRPVTIVRTIPLTVRPVLAHIEFPERIAITPPGQLPPPTTLRYNGTGAFFLLSDTSSPTLRRVTSQGQQNLPVTTPNGRVYTFTAGTLQNPHLKTATVSVISEYGPFKAVPSAVDEKGGITAFTPGAGKQLLDQMVYLVLLKGINGLNGKPLNYAMLFFMQQYLQLQIVVDPGWLPFQWTDPKTKEGTFTILSYFTWDNFTVMQRNDKVYPNQILTGSLYAMGFSGVNYGGTAIRLFGGNYRKADVNGSGLDQIRSIRIPPGLSVIVTPVNGDNIHNNTTLIGDQPDVTAIFANYANCWAQAYGVTLFQAANYVNDTHAGWLPGYTDMSVQPYTIGSLKIAPGFKVTLYQNADRSNYSQSYIADTPEIKGFNGTPGAMLIELI